LYFWRAETSGGAAFRLAWALQNLTRHKSQGHEMNWDRIEGQWKQLKGKALEKWGKLTDDDLDLIEGKREQLVGRVQELYGKRKDEAEREVDEWGRGLH
jgi:uncharacterized protein YjbJ (UPF0337 family)